MGRKLTKGKIATLAYDLPKYADLHQTHFYLIEVKQENVKRSQLRKQLEQALAGIPGVTLHVLPQ